MSHHHHHHQQRIGLKESSHLSIESSKQKRIEKQQLSTRQQKAKLLAKRRKLPPTTTSTSTSTASSSSTSTSRDEELRHIVLSEQGKSYLESLIQELDHEKHSMRIKSLKLLRTILSMSGSSSSSNSSSSGSDSNHHNNNNEDSVIIIGKCLSIPQFLPMIQKHLYCMNNESQLEAAWCITNIASSTHEHTKQVLPFAIRLIAYLDNADNVVREQCAWALGNIAADSPEYAHVLIGAGILKPLADLFGLKIPDLTRTVIWCLANVIRSVLCSWVLPAEQESTQHRQQQQHQHQQQSPPLSVSDHSGHGVVDATTAATPTSQPRYEPSIFFQTGHNFAPLLIKCLQSSHEEIATESAWALSYLATYPDYGLVFELIKLNILPVIIALLSRNTSAQILQQRISLTVPLLRILGSAARGPNTVIDSIFASSDISLLLQALMVQLQCTEVPSIQKETVWVVSNLATGSERGVDLLAQSGFVPPLLHLCAHSDVRRQYELKRESLYALMNMCSDARLMTVPIVADIMKGIGDVLGLVASYHPPVLPHRSGTLDGQDDDVNDDTVDDSEDDSDALLSLILQDGSNEEFTIACLNFIHFVLHVNSVQVEPHNQHHVKNLVPLTMIQQLQHRYHEHNDYQVAILNIMRFL